MIRHLEHHEIDRAKWDECIDKSPNSLIYACSWYLDIVSPQWEALVEDNYISVFPLTWKEKYNIKYLCQPFFTQQLGIFSVNTISSGLIKEFLLNVPQKFRFAEIFLNTENLTIPADFKKVSNSNYELNLNENYEILCSRFSTNTKRNIIKAQKNELKIVKAENADLIISLFRNNRGREIKKLKEDDYAVLKKLLEASANRNLSEFYHILYPDGSLCAGAVFIKSRNRYIFLFSGRDFSSGNKGAMFFLINNFISTHCRENSCLDFEGSNDRNLANFYRGFGAGLKIYFMIKKNSLPLHIRTIVNINKFIKNL